jgi:hypothetical protein
MFASSMRIFLRGFQVFLVVFFLATSVMRVQAIGSTDKDGVPDAGIQISPTKFVWTLKSGDKKITTINVKNYSKISQKVVIEVEDFYVGEDGSEPLFFIPDNNHPMKNKDIIKWITPPKDFVLAAGESKDVDFVVNVPAGQPTNGYYGGIFFKTGAPEKSKGTEKVVTMGINYRIGALVIMAVQGSEPMKIGGKLNEFYPSQKVFWQTPATLITKMTNTGNIHYPIFGKIEVNKFGKKFQIIELKPQLIYPDIEKKSTEKVMFSWWDFGKYDAHLSMWSQDESVKFEKSISFLVIPWKGLLVVFGGFLVLWILKKIFRAYIHIGKK